MARSGGAWSRMATPSPRHLGIESKTAPATNALHRRASTSNRVVVIAHCGLDVRPCGASVQVSSRAVFGFARGRSGGHPKCHSGTRSHLSLRPQTHLSRTRTALRWSWSRLGGGRHPARSHDTTTYQSAAAHYGPASAFEDSLDPSFFDNLIGMPRTEIRAVGWVGHLGSPSRFTFRGAEGCCWRPSRAIGSRVFRGRRQLRRARPGRDLRPARRDRRGDARRRLLPT